MVKSGSINGVTFGYQKKSVKPTIRIGKSETPGKLGTAIDTMGAGGIDITLDVIAQSITERDSLIAAFMQEGRGKLKPGTPDNDWYFSGVCGDYSTDFALSQYNPTVAYPLSFLFETDLPYLINDKVTTIGKQITAAGEEWFSADAIAFNQVQNSGFEYADTTGDYTEFSYWDQTSLTKERDIINVSTNPHGIAVHPSGTAIFEVNSGSNTFVSIATFNYDLRATVNVGNNPWGVHSNPAGTKAYVTNFTDNTVSVIDVPAYVVSATINVGTNPTGVKVSLDATKVFVACQAANKIYVINPATNTVSTTINVGTAPQGICLSPLGSRLYVANSDSNNVSVILTSNNTVESTINVGTNPKDVVSIAGKLYVANYGSNNVTIINTTNAPTYSVTKTITVGTKPVGLAASMDGKYIFVSNQDLKTVSVINSTTDTVVYTLDVGTKPSALASSSTTLYVSNYDDNTISVISPLPVILPEIFQDPKHKYGSKCLKIVNTNGLSKFGEMSQPIQFEEGVEYKIGFFGYIENPSTSEIVIELKSGNSALCSTRSVATNTFSLTTTTYTFTNTPTDTTIRIYISGNASSNTNHYIDTVYCMKSDDFNENLIGGFITTGNLGGTTYALPDIQIDSLNVANPMQSVIGYGPYSTAITQYPVSNSQIKQKVYQPPRVVQDTNDYNRTYTNVSIPKDNTVYELNFPVFKTETVTDAGPFTGPCPTGANGYSIHDMAFPPGSITGTITHVSFKVTGGSTECWVHLSGVVFGGPTIADTSYTTPYTYSANTNAFNPFDSDTTYISFIVFNQGNGQPVTFTDMSYTYQYNSYNLTLIASIEIPSTAYEHVINYLEFQCKPTNPTYIHLFVQHGTEDEIDLGSFTANDTTKYTKLYCDYSVLDAAGKSTLATHIKLRAVPIYKYETNVKVTGLTASYGVYNDGQFALIHTEDIPLATGEKHYLTGFSFIGHTTVSGNNANYQVTVQNGTGSDVIIYEGTVQETTDTTKSVSYSEFLNAVSPCNAGEVIHVKFLGKLANQNGGECHVQNITLNYNTVNDADYGTELLTLTIPSETDIPHTLTFYSFEGLTSNPNNPAQFKVSIQHGLDSPIELGVYTSTANYAAAGLISVPNLIQTGHGTEDSYLRFYGKLTNELGGTLTLQNCQLLYGKCLPYTLLNTLEIASDDEPSVITEAGLEGNTALATNPSEFYITLQNEGGDIIPLGDPLVTSTIDPQYSILSLKNLSVSKPAGVKTFIKFYGKLQNGVTSSLKSRNSYVNYISGTIASTTSIPKNVYIYNINDTFTKCNVCNELLHGCSLRINANGTGHFYYYDNYITNLYTSFVPESDRINVTWRKGNLIIGADGLISYTFDIRYPIDSTPFLLLNVLHGVPYIKIAVNEGGIKGVPVPIDDNVTSLSSGYHLWTLYSENNCNLSESTNITVQIMPTTSQGCVIGSLYLFCSTITVDAVLPKILIDKMNTFKIDMSEDAFCLVSLSIPDYKWGI
jgi:YVTN family beta-propeller protein